MVFPGGSNSKESVCSAGDPGSIPESGRFPGEESTFDLLDYQFIINGYESGTA